MLTKKEQRLRRARQTRIRIAQQGVAKSGKPSTQGPSATGERYLPAKAIKNLTASEYAATTRAKRLGTKQGKQFVPNTPAAKRAGRNARKAR